MLAVVIGVAAALVMYVAIRQFLGGLDAAVVDLERSKSGLPKDADVLQQVMRSHVAWQYAQAFQQQEWETVVTLTLWMQERLERVHRETGDAAAAARAREELIRGLKDNSPAGNRLRREGIEDQYILTPDAVLEPMGRDAGLDNLAQPSTERLWLKVTYPAPPRAPLDAQGLPIHAVTVGINVSESGQVMKAGIVGNLEIDWTSLVFDWK